MKKLKALWRGDLRLGDAFWAWALIGGLMINVTSSILFLILVMQDQLWPALLVGYGVSIPYNVMAVVGVWRSAARYDGPGLHADLARGATVILMIVLSLT